MKATEFPPEVFERYRWVLGKFPGPQNIKSPTDADVLCPVHGDRNPSLGVDLRENGKGPKVVLKCRSQGCKYGAILGAVGLRDEDLYLSNNHAPGGCLGGLYS